MRVFFVVFALILGQALPLSAQVSPSDLYVNALAKMQVLREPPYVTFSSDFQSPAMLINIGDSQGYATLYLLLKNGIRSNVSWRTDFRAASHNITLQMANGSRLFALSPVFDPTWVGAYNWLRYGLEGEPAPSIASPAQSNGLPTIALVTAVSPGAYDIYDGGAAACPSGSSGRRLHLRARSAPADHPLTDVIVDDVTNRFCSMRFTLSGGGPVYTMTGFMELHFSAVGGYWLITGGDGEVGMQMFGQTYTKAPITFQYMNVAFAPAQAPRPRPPIFTAALFRPPAATIALAPKPASTASLKPPLKTIVHVYSHEFCTTLTQNVARAIQGLSTDDTIFLEGNQTVANMGTAIADVSRFSETGRAQNSQGDYAGKHDTDPAVEMNQVKLERLIGQIEHNLEEIRAALADPKRFPNPPVSDQDRQMANLKADLLALAARQQALLNQLNALSQTTEMQQLIAVGDGTLGAINGLNPNPKSSAPPPRTSVDDTNLNFGDPLDENDPLARVADPSLAGGRKGGPDPSQPQSAPIATAPRQMANNPMAPFYEAAVKNENETHAAEDGLAKDVAGAALACR